MDLAYAGAALGAYHVVFGQTHLLAGWTYDEMMIFVGGWIVVDALQMIFVNVNLANFPSLVNKGDLDYYLIRPVSALFMVSLNSFTVNSCVNLLLSVGFLSWALVRYPGELSVLNVSVFSLLLLNGAFLYYVLRMLFLVPVFWLHSALGLEVLFFTCIRFAERPDDIFGPWLRRLLISFLPFAVMTSVPVKILVGDLSLVHAIAVFMLSAALFGVLLVVWNTGLRSYGSASS